MSFAFELMDESSVPYPRCTAEGTLMLLCNKLVPAVNWLNFLN